MLVTILIGIISSTAAEVATAINKKLQGTVLKGNGAFLVAFAAAIVGALFVTITKPGFQFGDLTNWQNLIATFSQVFTVSQVYFLLIAQRLGLDLSSDQNPAKSVAPATPAAPVQPAV